MYGKIRCQSLIQSHLLPIKINENLKTANNYYVSRTIVIYVVNLCKVLKVMKYLSKYLLI